MQSTTEVETWEAAGLIVRETEKAIHETKHGGAVVVVMPEWLAINKGLL